MCGEKCLDGIAHGMIAESPPRVRGKGVVHILVPEPLGITPAYAGKRRTGPAVRDRSWDHPRVCGEKNACWGVPQTPLGSPPRMRGKAGATRRNQASTRITPAYAGKRVITHDHPSGDQDHPRVCGEKGSRIFPDPADRGSPPRVRGKASYWIASAGWCRITPACAGKRLSL